MRLKFYFLVFVYLCITALQHSECRHELSFPIFTVGIQVITITA